MHCKSNSDGDSRIHWYQKKADQPPTLLFYWAVKRFSGIPEKYVGSGSGREFTFTVKGAAEDDAGVYYCHQFKSIPSTQ
ncbi:unnamed protein product [Staurois parvus]|uniref:Ig-like domain-containing protein n=1 Tax=Staurois parvus TaxID=386267 RepID=A0ABN9HJC0_9NEOB|nr:unnamed protein product [Staurois parvus]